MIVVDKKAQQDFDKYFEDVTGQSRDSVTDSWKEKFNDRLNTIQGKGKSWLQGFLPDSVATEVSIDPKSIGLLFAALLLLILFGGKVFKK